MLGYLFVWFRCHCGAICSSRNLLGTGDDLDDDKMSSSILNSSHLTEKEMREFATSKNPGAAEEVQKIISSIPERINIWTPSRRMCSLSGLRKSWWLGNPGICTGKCDWCSRRGYSLTSVVKPVKRLNMRLTEDKTRRS
jgi:hypothetical protein